MSNRLRDTSDVWLYRAATTFSRKLFPNSIANSTSSIGMLGTIFVRSAFCMLRSTTFQFRTSVRPSMCLSTVISKTMRMSRLTWQRAWAWIVPVLVASGCFIWWWKNYRKTCQFRSLMLPSRQMPQNGGLSQQEAIIYLRVSGEQRWP